MSLSSVISSKGQIVIPAALRKKYHLEEGATIVFHEEKGKIVLEPNNFAALRALRGAFSSPLEETLEAERKAERLREDNR